MKRIVTVMGFLLIQIPTFACICGPSSSDFDKEVENSDLIFIGIPVRQEKSDSGYINYFQIEKQLKGLGRDTVQINSGFGGIDCGFVFELKEKYIVFAENGKTGRCKRTAKYNLSPDLYALGQRFQGFDFTKEQFKSFYLEEHLKEIKKQDVDLDGKNPLLLFYGQKVSFEELLEELGRYPISNIWYFAATKEIKEKIGECVEDGVIYIEGPPPLKSNVNWKRIYKILKKSKPCI